MGRRRLRKGPRRDGRGRGEENDEKGTHGRIGLRGPGQSFRGLTTAYNPAMYSAPRSFAPSRRYKVSEAKSASRERSPRTRVMWPECGHPLKRFTEYVKPLVISDR